LDASHIDLSLSLVLGPKFMLKSIMKAQQGLITAMIFHEFVAVENGKKMTWHKAANSISMLAAL
jgi:hypothetical protein